MQIESDIKQALSVASGIAEADINIEIPSDPSHGDFSTNIAMAHKLNPNEIADKLESTISSDKVLNKNISKIEVINGFINFWLSPQYLLVNLQNVLEGKNNFGKNSLFNGKKIMVEYGHPNTHKEMHIGHMRTLILGEALARVFEFCGAEVFRANYQGDIGPHVAKALWGTRKLLEERGLSWELAQEQYSELERAKILGEGYVLGNKEYTKHKEEIDAINTAIYARDESVMDDYQRSRRWSLQYYDIFYDRFGVKYDELYFESDVASIGEKIVREHVPDVFTDSDGTIIFEGEKHGLHNRVFITGAGNPTYEGKEIGLAKLQYEDFKYDKNIHVVASEQKGYFEVVIAAIEKVFPQLRGKQYHLSMGMVDMMGMKMSSRTGKILRVDELLDQIKEKIRDKSINEEAAEATTIAAIKFSMMKSAPEQNVSFETEKSVDITGQSGPYLQYTYARAKSILTSAGSKTSGVLNNLSLEEAEAKYIGETEKNTKLSSEEKELMRIIAQFEGIIQNVSKNYSVQQLVLYLYNLAQSFNAFYNKHNVIGSEEEDFRLLVTAATAQVIKNGLNLLGIEAVEKM